MFIIGVVAYLLVCYLISDKIGRHRSLGFWKSFALCIILTPPFALIFVDGGGKKDPKGCKWCGNKFNEAEYCGICGKNEVGDIRPGFAAKKTI